MGTRAELETRLEVAHEEALKIEKEQSNIDFLEAIPLTPNGGIDMTASLAAASKHVSQEVLRRSGHSNEHTDINLEDLRLATGDIDQTATLKGLKAKLSELIEQKDSCRGAKAILAVLEGLERERDLAVEQAEQAIKEHLDFYEEMKALAIEQADAATKHRQDLHEDLKARLEALQLVLNEMVEYQLKEGRSIKAKQTARKKKEVEEKAKVEKIKRFVAGRR